MHYSVIFYVALQVSGGKDGSIHVWSIESNNHIHTFTGHRDSISVSLQTHTSTKIYV